MNETLFIHSPVTLVLSLVAIVLASSFSTMLGQKIRVSQLPFAVRQLVVTVVVRIVTEQLQGVALQHLDVSEGLERIGLFVEVGTVTIEVSAHVPEMDIAMQHLGITILKLVVVQVVSMYQIDPFVLHLLLSGSTLASWLHGKHHSQYQQTKNDKQGSLHHLTQPSYSN